MSRRDRIKARLIYRQWSIYRQLRWIPPYGWITKTAALAIGYRADPAAFLAAYPRPIGKHPALAMGYDPGAPGGDHSVVAFRRGREILAIHEIKMPTDAELLAALDRKAERFRDIYEALAQRIMRGEK